MKRIACALLALLMIAGILAGCSKQKEEETPSEPEASYAPVNEAAGPYHIGLVQYMEYAPLDEAREAFVNRLDEWGYDDGKVEINYQNAGGNSDKAAEICQKMVKDKVDVIVAISTPAAKAAAKAAEGSQVKVVFLLANDPQGELGVENLEQPQGNVTGVVDLVTAQAALDLAAQVNPQLASVGLLYDPGCTFGTAYVQAFKKVCEERNIAVSEGQAANSGEAAAQMAELCKSVDAVFSPVDSTISTAAADTAKAAQEGHKPWYSCTEDVVRQGALAGISVDYAEAGNKAADMTVQLAAGRPVRELPVYTFSSGRVNVNQAVMSLLDVHLPEEVLETANYCEPKQ